MKLEMTTEWLGLIQPGLYGTNLGYLLCEVAEEYTEDFQKQLCFEATSIMNEIFSEDWFVEKFGNYVVSNAKLHSPQYYNYTNDRIEFDLEIEKPELLIKDYYEEFDACNREEFLEWAEQNYGSYDGFISHFPYTYEKFEKALYSKEPTYWYSYERAIAMLLMYAIHKSNCALDSYQHDFENNMEEYCAYNGLLYEEDEE